MLLRRCIVRIENPFDFKTRNAVLVTQMSWHYHFSSLFDMEVNIK